MLPDEDLRLFVHPKPILIGRREDSVLGALLERAVFMVNLQYRVVI